MRSGFRLVCALFTLAALGCSAIPKNPGWGIVLEKVPPGSTLEKAGLRAGDVLYAWERLASPPANPKRAKGEIRTAFDWLWLRTEQAPRGKVQLAGERDGSGVVFEVPAGIWEGTVRPRLPDAVWERSSRSWRRTTASSGRASGTGSLHGDLGTRVSIAGLIPGRYRLRIEGLRGDRHELVVEVSLQVSPA